MAQVMLLDLLVMVMVMMFELLGCRQLILQLSLPLHK
jgi:hypothetical protein